MGKNKCKHSHDRGSFAGVFYFLGFLGAAIYYISNASSFWWGVLGFLKALVWPVFLIWEALNFFGA